MARNDSTRRQVRQDLLIALGFTAFVAALMSCGGTTSDDGTSNESPVRLAPDVRVVPMDGRTVVTAIGDDGIKLVGPALGRVRVGDVIIVAAPITPEARTAVGHIGGYIHLRNGMHIVPRRNMPARFHTPLTEPYDHFLIYMGRVTERVAEQGSFARPGARAYGSSTGGTPADFIGSITHALSSAASAVGHAATQAASDVENAATSAASVATEVVTASQSATASVATAVDVGINAVTAAGSEITSDVSSATSEVTNAVGPIGPSVLSAFKTVAADFSSIVEDGVLPLQKALTLDAQILQTDAELLLNYLEGNFDVTLDVDGNLTYTFQHLCLKSQAGGVEGQVCIDGGVSVQAGVDLEIDIHEYSFQSMSVTASIAGNANVMLDGMASGSQPLVQVTLDPVVAMAGELPLVFLPKISSTLVINKGDLSNALSASGSLNASAGFTVSGAGIEPQGSANASFSAEVSPQGTLDVTVMLIAVELSLYDTATIFTDFTLPDLDLEVNGEHGTLTCTVSAEGGFDFTALGYQGVSLTPLPLFSDQVFQTSF